jgi:hypothetical protein
MRSLLNPTATNIMKKLLLIAAFAGILPLAAQAESNFVTGTTTPITATAHLDFTVTIPKILYLQVGAGTPFVVNTTQSNLTFAVPAANVGNGTAVASTGGDQAGGAAVTIRVLGNSGNVTLTNTTTGQLTTGVAGNPTIPWTAFTVTAGALATTTTGFTNAAITHPTFNNAAGGGVSATGTTLNATGGLVQQEGSWTFAYANTATLPGGTYGGTTAASNGVVLYTASAP